MSSSTSSTEDFSEIHHVFKTYPRPEVKTITPDITMAPKDYFLSMVKDIEECEGDLLESLSWGVPANKHEIACIIVYEALKLAIKERKAEQNARRAAIHKRKIAKRNKKDIRDYSFIDLTKKK